MPWPSMLLIPATAEEVVPRGNEAEGIAGRAIVRMAAEVGNLTERAANALCIWVI